MNDKAHCALQAELPIGGTRYSLEECYLRVRGRNLKTDSTVTFETDTVSTNNGAINISKGHDIRWVAGFLYGDAVKILVCFRLRNDFVQDLLGNTAGVNLTS